MNRILFGDCRDSLRALAADGVRVQMCVTSPPYFGLRDYGVSGQIGLESSPDEYVAHMVEVFRAVRAVLADDGTLWLNIGDSYNAHPGQRKTTDKAGTKQHTLRGSTGAPSRAVEGIKPKDLIGIPWALAFALRADGWYLRQEIIWHKPNPMPESVTDRCTKAHESLFLLAKSERYFFDADSIREPVSGGAHGGLKKTNGVKSDLSQKGGKESSGLGGARTGTTRNRRNVWTVTPVPYAGAHFAVFPPALIEPCILAGSRVGDIVLDPFMGSGTTAAVALQHGRQYVGCELNRDYAPLQNARIAEALAGA